MANIIGERFKALKLALCYLVLLWTSNVPLPINGQGRPVYELVDWTVDTPQWLRHDHYVVTGKPEITSLIRFPPLERRYSFTRTNQDLVVVSSEDTQIVPSASKLLQTKKTPRRIFERRTYQPLLSTGTHARHKFSEGLHIRWRHIGSTDEVFMASLYMPTGWIMIVGVTFFCFVWLVPIVGAVLIHVGFKLAGYFKLCIWGPIKATIRWILIKRQLSITRWRKVIAPPHFLEPRTTWKLPLLLRYDKLEDVPCELAYKPPINTIDYTMYILTEEDYDEMDLGMDEMEFIDDLLQFRDLNPKVVARLLKHKLGTEKFYYYFDEDILSDESDEEEEEPPPPPAPEEPAAEEGAEPTPMELSVNEHDYLALLEADEPWMHDEYDDTFPGSLYQLEEIRKRRQIIQQLKAEMRYFHNLIVKDNMFDKEYIPEDVEGKRKALKKAKKMMDKYARFSEMTKERIAEIEPSGKTQTVHNPVLSKYLPLIDQMSHYNHRLNLKHEKQKDPERRKIQLDIFGGP